MSEVDIKTETLDHERPNAKIVNRPGIWLLLLGVILPSLVVGIEVLTRICADALFDPLPTLAHVPLTLGVPATNFWLWRTLRNQESPLPWLPFASGAAIAISFFYALWFLPLMPFAAVAVLFFGVGLLPLAPLFGVVVAVVLTRNTILQMGKGFTRRAWVGGAIGALTLIVLDLPSASTLLALRWSSEGGDAATNAVRVMRSLGNHDQLLRRSYNIRPPVVGPISFFLGEIPSFFSQTRENVPGMDSSAARELYFRLTGKSHTTTPPSSRQLRGQESSDFFFDIDQGGTEVGQRVAGLTLKSSRLDGSMQPEAAIANLEWTMEFANASKRQQEARLTLELPAGAVASQATLWVNGEPREASFGSRSATRAAYEKVVKRERRDPLLVTTSGADRLLVQAFPIEPGKSLKLRIGITAPMKMTTTGKPTLALPAIVDRNFVIDGQLKHLFWIDSAEDVRPSISEITAQPKENGLVQLRGSITDEQLVKDRPRLSAAAPSGVKISVTSMPESISNALLPEQRGSIAQSIAQETIVAPKQLIVVVDGSVGARPATDALQAALEKLPNDAVVGLIIAADPWIRIEPLLTSKEHKQHMLTALQTTAFRGGHDNAEALAQALEWLTEKPQSALVWIHGAQPVAFAQSNTRLQQMLERGHALPRLLMYQATLGSNKILNDHPWFASAEAFAATKERVSDIDDMFATMYSAAPRWTVRRAVTDAKQDPSASGDAIARMWAARRVHDLLAHKNPKREEALKLSLGARIITPVSGAVVLETDAEYKTQGLPMPDANAHQIPEPELLVLLVVGGFFLRVTMRRRTRAALA